MASNLLLHTNYRLPALVLMHVDFTRFTGTCDSSDVIFRSSDSVSGFFQHNSGPIRPIRSCFGVLFTFPFISDSTTNLCLFCLFPCALPCFLPFLASLFHFQGTTLPCVPTAHSCSTQFFAVCRHCPHW